MLVTLGLGAEVDIATGAEVKDAVFDGLRGMEKLIPVSVHRGSGIAQTTAAGTVFVVDGGMCPIGRLWDIRVASLSLQKQNVDTTPFNTAALQTILLAAREDPSVFGWDASFILDSVNTPTLPWASKFGKGSAVLFGGEHLYAWCRLAAASNLCTINLGFSALEFADSDRARDSLL